MPATALLPLIVLAGFIVEAGLGFGSSLVILSLGSLLLPTSEVLARVVPLNVLLSLAVVIRGRASVDVRALVTRILPAMALGFPFGLYALHVLSPRRLTLVFAAFVFVLSVTELVALFSHAREQARAPLTHLKSLTLLFLGGVAHGALASGGPPVVYVAARTLPDKAAFRATLSALWLVLNVVLCLAYLVDAPPRITASTLVSSLPLVPALVGGLALGEIVHRKVDERAFRLFVAWLLLVVAVVLARLA